MSERLCVVMPVYNEEAAIGGVLEKWVAELDRLGIDYTIRPYNDGSRDGSLAVMREIAAKHSRVDVRDKPNGGHGNTILTGYREAAAEGFDWVFQVDSDDEMGPEKFGELWAERRDKDFLVGIREGRRQPLARKVISFVSRLCVRLFYGKGVWDVNTPYRLMRVSAFRDFYNAIPLTTFAPNVILSGLAARHNLRSHEIRVPQHDRMTGEVSIKKWKLLKAAACSFGQTVFFAWRSATIGARCIWLFGAVLTVAAAASVVAGFVNGWREYDFQWDPAKLLFMKDNPYLYTLQRKPVLHPGFMQQYIDANQVPSCLMLLAPFTLLPQLTANYVWDVCNLLFTATFLLLVWKLWLKEKGAGVFWVVTCLFLAGMPWRNLVGNGQHLMFSLSFFIASIWAAERRRFWLAGILLAFSMFKYTTTAPMALVFICRRELKPLIVCGVMHIAMTLWAGWWLDECPVALILQAFTAGSMLVAQGQADIASLVVSLSSSKADARFWAFAGYVIWGFVCAFVALWRRHDNDWYLRLTILAIASNVLCYHRSYDFVTLIFPMVLVVRDWPAKKIIDRMIVGITALNVGWFFWGMKIVRESGFGFNEVFVCFCLMNGLVIALLAKLRASKKYPSFVSINTGES